MMIPTCTRVGGALGQAGFLYPSQLYAAHQTALVLDKQLMIPTYMCISTYPFIDARDVSISRYEDMGDGVDVSRRSKT